MDACGIANLARGGAVYTVHYIVEGWEMGGEGWLSTPH